MANETKTPPTAQPSNDELRRREKLGQESLSKRITPWHPSRPRDEDAAVAINSKLTTKEHIGNHPDEPNKPDEDERAKGGTLKQREFDVKTVPISTSAEGETTDHVVVSPAAAAPAPHPALHRDDAIGTAAIVAEATAKKAKKGEEAVEPPSATADIVGKVQAADSI